MKLEDFKCIENIDIDKYYNYFLKIKNEMEHPDWLGDLKKEDFEYFINNGSKSWTYFDNDKFVCSYMYLVETQNVINYLGLNYDAKECADCGPVFVAKEYRGNGLQYQMLQKLEEYCSSKDLKYILTTAEPDNIYSCNNFEKAGYEKVGFKILERGPRNIYVKKILS